MFAGHQNLIRFALLHLTNNIASYHITLNHTKKKSSDTMTAPTLGMRLDAMLSSLDNMTSFQMYSLIVATTLVFCLGMLGTDNGKELIVTDDVVVEEEDHHPKKKTKDVYDSTSKKAAEPVVIKPPKKVLPPAAATPVCSDSSTQKSVV